MGAADPLMPGEVQSVDREIIENPTRVYTQAKVEGRVRFEKRLNGIGQVTKQQKETLQNRSTSGTVRL